MFKWIKDAKKLPQAIREREAAEAREHEANRIAATAQQNLSVERAKVADLEAKIRKQTEADLLLISMQIVNRIAAGEKKDTPVMTGLLQQQAAMMQNVYPYGMDYAGMGNLGMLAGQAALSGLWYDQWRR